MSGSARIACICATVAIASFCGSACGQSPNEVAPVYLRQAVATHSSAGAYVVSASGMGAMPGWHPHGGGMGYYGGAWPGYFAAPFSWSGGWFMRPPAGHLDYQAVRSRAVSEPCPCEGEVIVEEPIVLSN